MAVLHVLDGVLQNLVVHLVDDPFLEALGLSEAGAVDWLVLLLIWHGKHRLKLRLLHVLGLKAELVLGNDLGLVRHQSLAPHDLGCVVVIKLLLIEHRVGNLTPL